MKNEKENIVEKSVVVTLSRTKKNVKLIISNKWISDIQLTFLSALLPNKH